MEMKNHTSLENSSKLGSSQMFIIYKRVSETDLAQWGNQNQGTCLSNTIHQHL